MFRFKPDFFQRYSMSREEVCCKLLVKVRGRRCGIECLRTSPRLQSVISVLGRGTQAQSVNRIDLKIIDNEDDLDEDGQGRQRNGKRRGAYRAGRDAVGDDGDGDRSAKLVIKLICKHGEFARIASP